jgi:hypothetical protein
MRTTSAIFTIFGFVAINCNKWLISTEMHLFDLNRHAEFEQDLKIFLWFKARVHWLSLYAILRRDFVMQRGEISCRFLPPGGNLVPRYVLSFLFSEKSQNC